VGEVGEVHVGLWRRRGDEAALCCVCGTAHACMLHAYVVYNRVRRRSCGVVLVLSIDTGEGEKSRSRNGTGKGVMRLLSSALGSRTAGGWIGGEEGVYIYPCPSILWLVTI
jgi:hypothetical protein